MQRRDFVRIVALALGAPPAVVRAALDPLRSVPSAIGDLSIEHLLGVRRPRLRPTRWSVADLLPEASGALEAMTRAAFRDGVDVCARGGHRTFGTQRNIWNRKYRGDDPVFFPDGSTRKLDSREPEAARVATILHYVAFPGTSRHHWGTDVDISQTFGHHCAGVIIERFGGSAGGRSAPPGEAPEVAPPAGRSAAASRRPAACLEAHRWLLEHAAGYGFHLVYDRDRGGFAPEPWHWSYLSHAIPALARFIEQVTPDHLRGRNVAAESLVLDRFDDYRLRHMLGIHPAAVPSVDGGRVDLDNGGSRG
ncbi:MAG: M15 family metallopeptidase [Myxococcota bacterium]|nr:M15 family metallopeptidase [Myxococcota bacterium]